MITTARVVPRSGCTMISAQTSPTRRPSGINSSFIVSGGLRRLARISATTSSVPSLANSDGWIVKGPTASQRDAPFAATPMPGMRTAASPISDPMKTIGASFLSQAAGMKIRAIISPTPAAV